MSSFPSNLDVFLRSVRRRAGTWQVIESTALGLALGACAGSLLAGLMLWTGGDGRTMAIVTSLAGAAAGLAYGAARWPSLLAAGGEADRQFHLHELIATALMMRVSNDPWARLVVAQANRRAGHLQSRDLRLRRLGGRAWGGIAIAVAFVGVLALLSAPAGDVPGTARNDPTSRVNATDNSVYQTAADAVRPPSSVEAASKDGSVIPTADPRAGEGGTSRAHDAGTSPAAGSGRGAAQSTPPSAIIPPDSGRLDAVPEAGSTIGSGDGQSTSRTDGTGDAAGGRVMADRPAEPPRSLTPAALGPTRNGVAVPLDAIPDAYHDVVRFYFDATGR
jgi:hypothetical protein